MFFQRTRRHGPNDETPRHLWQRKPWRSNILIYLVLLSSLVNVFQALLIGLSSPWIKEAIASAYNNYDESIYHEPARSIRKPVYPATLYDEAVIAQTVEEVIDAYDPGNSIAALPRKGLLSSQPFPWDSSKDVYAYHGYHSLHSVQVIYQMLRELAGNEAISGHALHSLVVLWEDSLCTVDMTPRSVNRQMLYNDTAVAEAGQFRVCRDWAQVERMAREHNACFKDLGAAKARIRNVEEWLHCPQGSPYQDKVNEYIAHRGPRQ